MGLGKYVRAHWRGELSLLVSVVVSGLLVGVVLVGVLIAIGQVVTGVEFVYAALVVFVLWAGWADVGIFRAAIRDYQSTESSLLRRMIAVGAMVVVVIIAAVIFDGLLDLFP